MPVANMQAITHSATFPGVFTTTDFNLGGTGDFVVAVIPPDNENTNYLTMPSNQFRATGYRVGPQSLLPIGAQQIVTVESVLRTSQGGGTGGTGTHSAVLSGTPLNSPGFAVSGVPYTNNLYVYPNKPGGGRWTRDAIFVTDFGITGSTPPSGQIRCTTLRINITWKSSMAGYETFHGCWLPILIAAGIGAGLFYEPETKLKELETIFTEQCGQTPILTDCDEREVIENLLSRPVRLI